MEPGLLYLWLDIKVTPGEGFPSSPHIEDEIARNIAQGIEGRERPGKTFYLLDVWIDGTVETAVTSTPDGVPEFAPVDQLAGPRQIIVSCASRIKVTVVRDGMR